MNSYQRLEFLGDKVIGLVVSKWLFEMYPQAPEGDLTVCFGIAVSNDTFTIISSGLGVGDYLFLGFGQEINAGRTNPKVLADVFESITGAIFLDGGLRAAEKFLEKLLISKIPSILADKAGNVDPKGKLQRVSQEKFQITPIYKYYGIPTKSGGEVFLAEVFIEDVRVGRGEANSKTKASIIAARDALKTTKDLTKVSLALLKKRDVVKEISY